MQTYWGSKKMNANQGVAFKFDCADFSTMKEREKRAIYIACIFLGKPGIGLTGQGLSSNERVLISELKGCCLPM